MFDTVIRLTSLVIPRFVVTHRHTILQQTVTFDSSLTDQHLSMLFSYENIRRKSFLYKQYFD